MKIFVVIRKGVYQQGVFGIFDDLIKATDHASVSIENEKDDYHIFQIYETNLNDGLCKDVALWENINPILSLIKNKDKVDILKHGKNNA